MIKSSVGEKVWTLFNLFQSFPIISTHSSNPFIQAIISHNEIHHFFSCNHPTSQIEGCSSEKNSNSADLGPKKSIFAGKIVASKENQRINPCVVDHNWGLGKDSFAQKVWHSPMYTQWWRELVEAGGEGCCSLAAAKHRFSSYLVPLTRICHNMPAMIQLCHKIATLRSESGRWAVQLLKTFSGFKAIVLGLAADAAASSNQRNPPVSEKKHPLQGGPIVIASFQKHSTFLGGRNAPKLNNSPERIMQDWKTRC